ncbi:hypothetical protein CHS0354_013691 [Potamilus streckersoni]|uniref:SAM domain-containing protein n=1 Tax=Potamilus streckersoni TaxID=2493646 RepID=A0AAE0RQG7_9BIVA|nr:hypothetical protein CHS0354_013691 [Potamilus streckersoni]
MEFITHSTRYKISDFYQQFGKDLPKLVMVTDGYFGETKDTTFKAGQIIRFHTYSRQRRIKAVAKETDSSSETVYSIPLDHSNPMIICDEKRIGNEAWNPLLLTDIIENYELPLPVHLDETDKCEDSTSALIATITLRKGYDEIFLLGNTIEDGIRLYKTKSTFRRQQPLRGLRRRISKLFLSHGSLSMPEADTVLSFRPSTTQDDGLYGETNAGLRNYSTLHLTRRTVSCYNKYDDSELYLMCHGETIITVTDVSNLLKKLKLEQYVTQFQESGINGQILFTLNEKVLEEKYNFRKVDTLKLMFFIRTGHIPQ